MNREIQKNTEFDPSGQYDSGLQALVKSFRLAFIVLAGVIIAMVVYFITLGGYIEVRPQQSVIVLRFGKFHAIHDRGWWWYIPYPMTSAIAVPTNPQTFKLSFMAAGNAMAEQQEAGGPLEPGRDSYLLTADANIIHTSWSASYRITDPERYYLTLGTPADPAADDVLETSAEGIVGRTGPRALLQNLLAQAVIQITSTTAVDDILYEKKSAYASAVEARFIKLLADSKCGVELNALILDYAAPPRRTKAAFDEVSAAGNTQSSLISQAREYQVKTENQMLAECAELLAAANTYKLQVVATIEAESIYFKKINAEYTKSPRTVLTTLYNNTIAQAVGLQEGKYVLASSTPTDRKQVRIKLNPEPPRPAEKKNAEGK